ncbi:MAG TPA: helix-turn-helix transcriptional regulator [Candidatus Angelobacter sp.]|nr:helix-turn-helix transcriptional regulator [Candidatus Angelobacter sp.]
MPKKSSPLLLPPLSRSGLQLVQSLEESAYRDLSASFRRGSLNAANVTAILGTYVVNVISVELAYYTHLENYSSIWDVEIKRATVETAIGMLCRIDSSDSPIVKSNLYSIIENHLRTKSFKTETTAKTPTIPHTPNDAKSIGNQIDDLRCECEMTVEALAEALHLTPRSVYRHLSGQADPRKTHLAAYAKVFSGKLQRQVILNSPPHSKRH